MRPQPTRQTARKGRLKFLYAGRLPVVVGSRTIHRSSDLQFKGRFMETCCRKTILALLFALPAALASLHANADAALARWVPDQSGATVVDSDPVPGLTVVPNLAADQLTQTGAIGLSNTLVWPVAVSTPRSNARYLQFSVTPSAGRVLFLRRIVYPARSFSDSDLRLHLRSSLDAFAVDLASAGTTGIGFREADLRFDLGGNPSGSIGAITFRLYPDRVGGAADSLDLRAEGLVLEGDFARRQQFSTSQFYSFSNEAVGGFEIPDSARNIRFVLLGVGTMRLQNQVSGDARVLCLPGQRDFFATTVLDVASVTAQFPSCLDIGASNQPSDVSIWKLPDGRLFRFQVLQFTVTGSGDDAAVSGTFQAGPIKPLRIFGSGFEG